MSAPLTRSSAQERASDFDIECLRRHFPILGDKVYGKPLVYLDNAATSQKPQAVIDAVSRFYSKDNANVHRGVHYLAERATEEYEGARAKVRRFLNAEHASEIIFVRGTTEAINLVAQTYGKAHVGAGDEVLITAMEHHLNIVPWQMLCEDKGARLRVARINDAGELLLEARSSSDRVPGSWLSRTSRTCSAPSIPSGASSRWHTRAARACW